MRTVRLLFLLLTTVPATLAAQRVPLPVGPGDRVMVVSRISPDRFEGVVMDVDQNALMIAVRHDAAAMEAPSTAGRIDTIPISAIRTLHVHRPIDAGVRARSALGWGMLLAGAGALTGVAAVVVMGDGGGSGAEPFLGAFAGMLAGGTIGAVYGAQRPNPWDSVELPNPARQQR